MMLQVELEVEVVGGRASNDFCEQICLVNLLGQHAGSLC